MTMAIATEMKNITDLSFPSDFIGNPGAGRPSIPNPLDSRLKIAGMTNFYCVCWVLFRSTQLTKISLCRCG